MVLDLNACQGVSVWLGIALAMCVLALPVEALADTPPLKYDTVNHPVLKWGYNDLNKDGVADTLITRWNGKVVALVFDGGRLPWPAESEGQDWNAYLNQAFNVGEEPPVIWNEMRAGWGTYSILVDRDECGRFDTFADWYYKALDLNGDGYPEGEYYQAFPGDPPGCHKIHFNLNGERDMSYLDFRSFCYTDEQRYLAGGKYIMNVHGNGFFENCYSANTQKGWETPIAWYDFDCNGKTNMVMRCADTHLENGEYRGQLGEFEVAFELNGDTSDERWHSLDMQLTYYNYDGQGLDYTDFIDTVPQLKSMPAAAYLSEGIASTRFETIRRHMPYMDGYRIGTDFTGWAGVFLLFDEDNDDIRWEEMFARYEEGWSGYGDKIGDRFERDADFGGSGKLYVGKFDGRIHLYHSEFSVWDVDYLGLYKGSQDRGGTDEGPVPPTGLRYPRVRYSDTNGNGFIDRIEYTTAEYGNEANTERVERVVDLLSFAGADSPDPDVCPLVDPRVNAPITGWNLSTWDGKPLTPESFQGTPVEAGFDKMYDLYTSVADRMWSDAMKLYSIAKKYHLNKSETLDQGLKTSYTKAELAELRTYDIPKGYSRHLAGATRRQKYDNGYWLKEKVFADILRYSGLDRFQLQKLYYTGTMDRLSTFIELGLRPGAKDVTGLLGTAWGRVTFMSEDASYFYMDDGSSVSDGSGHVGVRVQLSGLVAPIDRVPRSNDYVAVTGLIGRAADGDLVTRVIRPRSNSDITLLEATANPRGTDSPDARSA